MLKRLLLLVKTNLERVLYTVIWELPQLVEIGSEKRWMYSMEMLTVLLQIFQHESLVGVLLLGVMKAGER